MIRYEPLRPVSFPVLALLAVRPVFTAVLAFLSQPLLIIFFLYETNYTASMLQGKLWQVGCEVQIGNGGESWCRLQPLSLAIGE